MSDLKFSQDTEIAQVSTLRIISMLIIIVRQQPGMYEDKRAVRHPVILYGNIILCRLKTGKCMNYCSLVKSGEGILFN